MRERISRASMPDKSAAFNTSRLEALELDNLMDVAEATAIAAEQREESRGGHTRDDFPGHEDEFWGKNLNICWMEDGEIKIRQEEVEEMRGDLKDAIKEVKAMIAERAAEQGGGN